VTPSGGDNTDPPPGGGDTTTTSPVDDAKVTEVTLPKLGTYYISVKPNVAPGAAEGSSLGELHAYNIAANLQNTGQITPDSGDNFFDTETEPNDDRKDADPIRSNVSMVGVFDRTLIKTWYPPKPASSEILYFYKGCSESNPSSVPLGLTSCECDLTALGNSDNITPNNPNFKLTIISQQPTIYTAPGDGDTKLNPIFDDDLGTSGVQVPPATLDDGGTPNNSDDGQFELTGAVACEAREVSTAATPGEWKGSFAYDVDNYMFHSDGNEQLRIQICTRSDCQFEELHLRVNRAETGQVVGLATVIMEGPMKPGQTIDLGAAWEGDYYFEFSAQKKGVVADTGNPIETDLIGPYDVLLMSTKFKPNGN